MSRDEANAVLAVKNAWLGVVASAEEVVKLAPSVQALPDDTTPASLDYETYHRILGGHANAVAGLRGLLDDLKRKLEPPV
jgi:hypothetical protein